MTDTEAEPITLDEVVICGSGVADDDDNGLRDFYEKYPYGTDKNCDDIQDYTIEYIKIGSGVGGSGSSGVYVYVKVPDSIDISDPKAELAIKVTASLQLLLRSLKLDVENPNVDLPVAIANAAVDFKDQIVSSIIEAVGYDRNFVAKAIAAIPRINAAITGLLEIPEIVKSLSDRSDLRGVITQFSGAVGAVLGGFVGAEIGAIVGGTFASAVVMALAGAPVLTITAIGAALGAASGGYFGGTVMEKIFEEIFSALGSNKTAVVFSGTNGFDGISGNDGNDKLNGGGGGDIIFGDGGYDLLLGGEGNDTLIGSSGFDTLSGENGIDTLSGGTGSDHLDGGTGSDYLDGGAGNDTCVVDDGGDNIIETATGGIDLINSSISIDLTGRNGAYANVENLTLTGTTALNGYGTAANNVMTGNAAVNILSGREGNDSLRGYAGNDTLDGGTGDDTLDGGTGDDTLDGGTGVDRMSGGAGNDIYFVDNAGDIITETATGGTDRIYSSISIDLTGRNGAFAHVEDIVLSGTAALNGYGTAANNLMAGNAAANTLSGREGADSLSGGAGNDLLAGGSGADSFLFRKGFDQDLISDFQDNVDTIRLLDFGVTSFAQARNHATQKGADVVFDFGAGDLLTIRNTTINALADDMLFV